MGANIEPGFMAPYFMEEKPCAAKKSRRRENPVSVFTNGDCSETVFLPSQKRKRANAKASGNDGKLAIRKSHASPIYTPLVVVLTENAEMVSLI